MKRNKKDIQEKKLLKLSRDLDELYEIGNSRPKHKIFCGYKQTFIVDPKFRCLPLSSSLSEAIEIVFKPQFSYDKKFPEYHNIRYLTVNEFKKLKPVVKQYFKYIDPSDKWTFEKTGYSFIYQEYYNYDNLKILSENKTRGVYRFKDKFLKYLVAKVEKHYTETGYSSYVDHFEYFRLLKKSHNDGSYDKMLKIKNGSLYYKYRSRWEKKKRINKDLKKEFKKEVIDIKRGTE